MKLNIKKFYYVLLILPTFMYCMKYMDGTNAALYGPSYTQNRRYEQYMNYPQEGESIYPQVAQSNSDQTPVQIINYNKPNELGRLPLCQMIRKNRIEEVLFTLDDQDDQTDKINVNLAEEDGTTALHEAVGKWERIDNSDDNVSQILVRDLINLGANIHAKGIKDTPLSIAEQKGSEFAKKLKSFQKRYASSNPARYFKPKPVSPDIFTGSTTFDSSKKAKTELNGISKFSLLKLALFSSVGIGSAYVIFKLLNYKEKKTSY